MPDVRTLRTWLAAAGVSVVACSFVPNTGVPIDTSPDTPLSTIDNLLDAYETRRIHSFEELFLADSFRFYLSPQLVASGITPEVNVGSEEIDSFFVYVPEGTYSYWSYDDEMRSHRLVAAPARHRPGPEASAQSPRCRGGCRKPAGWRTRR